MEEVVWVFRMVGVYVLLEIRIFSVYFVVVVFSGFSLSWI